jgi:hypothetical protein
MVRAFCFGDTMLKTHKYDNLNKAIKMLAECSLLTLRTTERYCVLMKRKYRKDPVFQSTLNVEMTRANMRVCDYLVPPPPAGALDEENSVF